MLLRYIKTNSEKSPKHGEDSSQSVDYVISKACKLAHKKKTKALREYLHNYEHQFPALLSKLVEYLIEHSNLSAIKFLINYFKVNPSKVVLDFIKEEKFESAKEILSNDKDSTLMREVFLLHAKSPDISFTVFMKFIFSYKSEGKQNDLLMLLLEAYASVNQCSLVNDIIAAASTEKTQHELKIHAVKTYAANNFPGDAGNLVTWEPNKRLQHKMLIAAITEFSKAKERLRIYYYYLEDYDDDNGRAILNEAIDIFLANDDMEEICYILNYVQTEQKSHFISRIATYFSETKELYLITNYAEFIGAKLGIEIKRKILAAIPTNNINVTKARFNKEQNADEQRFIDLKSQIKAIADKNNNLTDLFAIFVQELQNDQQLNLKKYYIELVCKQKNALKTLDSLFLAETDVNHVLLIKKYSISTFLLNKKEKKAAKIIIDTDHPDNKLSLQRHYILIAIESTGKFF